MTAKKKSLKTLRENQEHLPVHASDAASEVPDTLAGKVGKKDTKAPYDGKEVAMFFSNFLFKRLELLLYNFIRYSI